MKIKNFFPHIAFFLITLQSYYFQVVSSSLLVLIGSVLMLFSVMFKNTAIKNISTSNFKYILLVTLFFIIYSFFEILNNGPSVNPILAYIFVMVSILGVILLDLKIQDIINILKYTLILHSFVIIFQLIFWIFFGEYLDLLYPITGESQRVISSKGLFVNDIRMPRFSGLYNEPGTYAVHIFSIMALYFYFVRKLDLIIVLTLSTILITMSFFGLILSIIFLLISLSDKIKFESLVIYFMFIAGIMYFSINEFIERIYSDYSGFDERFETFQLIESAFLYGLNSDKLIMPIDDSSLFIARILHGGIIEFFSFMAIFVFAAKGNVLLMLLLFSILLTKLKIMYPLIWIIIFLFVVKRRKIEDCQG